MNTRSEVTGKPYLAKQLAAKPVTFFDPRGRQTSTALIRAQDNFDYAPQAKKPAEPEWQIPDTLPSLK